MFRRILGLVLLVVGVALPLVVLDAVPASASTACTSIVKHWSIRDGSIPINIGWVELRIEVCTNGSVLTSSSASTDKDTTGPGTAAGFVVSASSPYRTAFNSGGFGGGSTSFSANGTNRDCLPGGITVFCGYTEDWRVNGQILMLNALNVRATQSNQFVLNNRVFQYSWSAGCTNSVCKTRFS